MGSVIAVIATIAVIGFIFTVLVGAVHGALEYTNAALNRGVKNIKTKALLWAAKKNKISLLNPEYYPADLPSEFNNILDRFKTDDKVTDYLKRYSPSIQELPPFPPSSRLIYKSRLSPLYRSERNKWCLIASNNASITDLKSILSIKDKPAYLWLYENKHSKIVCFDDFVPKKPKAPAPPVGWTEWSLPKKYEGISSPKFQGIYKPFNLFFHEIYAPVIKKIDHLNNDIEKLSNRVLERNKQVRKLYDEATIKYQNIISEQNKQWDEYIANFKNLETEYFNNYDTDLREINRLIVSVEDTSIDGLLSRVKLTLKFEELPNFVPDNFDLKIDSDSRILIIEHQFPDIGELVWTKDAVVRDKKVTKTATQKEIKECASFLYPSLTLRIACEIARLDVDNHIDGIVVNGWANHIQKRNGLRVRAYCSSLFVKKIDIASMNLPSLHPVEAFSSLKGVSARTLELTPITPVLRLNKDDSRFVDAKDILDYMDEHQNIASMNWEDFEHLCRELFEKAFAGSGAEVKVTQASRDQGVDAVIFDPDILRGGKIVVQAKRYTNLVDVSAVRDLYGAIINEGAIKGILVTTSSYGPDAYSFANGKPITLINGQELLGLLAEYGYKFRINLEEAKKMNAINQGFFT